MNKVNSIKNHIDSLNGKFFTVTFTKKDGSIRKMNARTGVKKYLKGGVNLNSNPNHLIVFDMAIKEYRTVDLVSVQEIASQYHKFSF